MKVSFAIVAVVPLAFSCGGDDKPHMILGVDAPGADAPEACKGQAMYTPNFGSDQGATNYPAMGSGSSATGHQLSFAGALDSGTPGDVLYIDLYQDYGAFTGSDIHTGQFTISGDETTYSTCGVCVTIGAPVASDGTVDDWYMATGGIVNLTTITGNLKGSLQNVNFRRVVTKPDNGLPGDTPEPGPAGDCTSHISTASFDAPIVAGSAARIAIPVSRLGIGGLEHKLPHRYY
jgi:hypothetical protein